MFEARFQTFEDASARAQSAARVAALRAELKRRGLDGFVVPRADRQQNEYVPACEERLAWLTGFTGSAGAAVVLRDARRHVRRRPLHAAGATRRSTRRCSRSSIWSRPARAMARATTCKSGAKLGYDPWLHTAEQARAADARPARLPARRSSPVDRNPIDAIWTDRPAPPLGAVSAARPQASPARRRLTSSSAIRAEIDEAARRRAGGLRSARTSPGPSTSAAPTSRTRRCRSPSPSCRARAGRRSTSTAAKLDNAVRARSSKSSPTCASPTTLARELDGARQRQDRAARPGDRAPTRCRAIIDERRRQGRARAPIPIALMKAVKNHAEIAGARAAHLRDGAAVARFLAWLDREAPERQAHRDRRRRGAGKLPPRHRRCSRTFRSRPSPAPGRTAPSCITA